MIAVDTSALLAIALREPQGEACRNALRGHERLLISAGTVVEALIVAGRRGFGAQMDALLAGFGFEVVAVLPVTAHRVAAVHAKWGKGVHPAALNFGDCFAYEVAHSHACPLLYIGNDFAKTDIRSALASA